MTSISYVAAYDPYHAMFRYLTLSSLEAFAQLAVDTYRIVDFYFLFPSFLSEFKASRDVDGLIKSLNLARRQYSKPSYQLLPPSKVLFERMRLPQNTALTALASSGFISRNSLDSGTVVRKKKPTDSQTAQMISKALETSTLLTEALALMTELSLNGPHGLKARSNLLESRYDYV